MTASPPPAPRDALAAIHAAEVALVAAAGTWQAAPVAPAWAFAVVASKFLAASSPHALGLYWDRAAWGERYLSAAIAGFEAVFHPREVRVVAGAAAAAGAIVPAPRAMRYRDVMAADVVMHVGPAVEPMPLRRGAHVVWVGPVPPPLAAAARPEDIYAAVALGADAACRALPRPWQRLSDIVAGRVDGRQLDEITLTWLCTDAG